MFKSNKNLLVIFFGLFLVISFLLVGCSHDKSTNVSNNTTTTDNTQNQQNNQNNNNSNNGNNNNQQNNGDEDPYKDWQTYRNEEYGYSLKYPKNWTVKEVDQYDNDFDVQVKYVSFLDGKSSYLTFYLWNKDETFSTGRTGVGAGDFINQRYINVDSFRVEFKDLVYKDKIKEVFFSGNSSSHKLGGYFSSQGDYEDSSLKKEKVKMIEKVIESLNFGD